MQFYICLINSITSTLLCIETGRIENLYGTFVHEMDSDFEHCINFALLSLCSEYNCVNIILFQGK